MQSSILKTLAVIGLMATAASAAAQDPVPTTLADKWAQLEAALAEDRQLNDRLPSGNVDATPNNHPTWDWIEVQINQTVAQIGADQPKAALAIYTTMVLRLTADWLPDSEANLIPSTSAASTSSNTHLAVINRSNPL